MDWRSFAWAGGAFDTARRPYTASVDGTILTPDHLVLVTLRGGAEHLEVATACGHRYAGPDRPGAVSFVPAHCERRIQLKGVQSAWASVALSPSLLSSLEEGGHPLDLAPFSNVDDPVLAGLVGELERLLTADGRLDPAYCEAISRAIGCYLSRRYGQRLAPSARRPWKLPPWRVLRITDYIEAHIDREILVSDLAALVGVSAGHLHRAFRATTGVTPLDYINERRIRRAMAILASEDISVAELALRVGFLSPSHFTRTFRRVAGVNPSRFRSSAGGSPRRSGR
ncbi:helix-turn-helix transcriptional regulator [Sorangium sp. So ce341]|uniref:helix-turn-helix transcriptional regulator n=1 Tax=Sorangium sp. So ce341 TaxID=3133302 RepID=UPI003F60775A